MIEENKVGVVLRKAGYAKIHPRVWRKSPPNHEYHYQVEWENGRTMLYNTITSVNEDECGFHRSIGVLSYRNIDVGGIYQVEERLREAMMRKPNANVDMTATEYNKCKDEKARGEYIGDGKIGLDGNYYMYKHRSNTLHTYLYELHDNGYYICHITVPMNACKSEVMDSRAANYLLAKIHIQDIYRRLGFSIDGISKVSHGMNRYSLTLRLTTDGILEHTYPLELVFEGSLDNTDHKIMLHTDESIYYQVANEMIKRIENINKD
jgi:hypothetical protein